MNILFLTLADYKSVYVQGLYSDLLRQFINNGDEVYLLSAFNNNKSGYYLIEEPHAKIIKVPIVTMEKTNIVKKGLSMLTVNRAFKKGIKKYLKDVFFDLVIYPTPPISLLGSVSYIIKRDNAKSYLLLKDIFPQNAVDLGIIRKTGLKGFIYKYFRKQEKKLYHISDRIGCMSQANVDYVLKHNPEINSFKVEVCPNSLEVVDNSVDEETKKSIRIKYNIPLDKMVFVYGGNLGKPQGIPFLIECLKKSQDITEVYFLIIGDGTEYGLLNSYIEEEQPANVKLMQRLPKEEYDCLVGACNVGLIFLDHRFSIPNFPSRLLSYMQAKIPVLACTDPNTDIGKVITEGRFGWWCESNNAEEFTEIVKEIVNRRVFVSTNTEWEYLQENYSVNKTFNIILSSVNTENSIA